MKLFKKTVGTRCLGQVDAECPNFVNKTLLPAHKRYDECGSQVQEVLAANYAAIISLVAIIGAVLGGGGAYSYYRAHKAAIDTADQIRNTIKQTMKDRTQSPVPQEPPKRREGGTTQPSIVTISRKVDDALLDVSFKNGMGYAANHMYENAIKEFSGVEAKNPNYPDLQMNMGAAYMQLKQYGKAREYLRRAQQQDSHNPNVFFNLACLSARTGNTEEGLQDLRSAINLGFRDVQALRSDPDLVPLRKTREFASLIRAVSQH